jgi:hypothetical protein
MSFSFQTRSGTKEGAKGEISRELASVASGQPSHANDAPVIEAAAHAFVDQLQDDPDRVIHSSISGSVSWDAKGASSVYATINVSLIKG